MASIADIYTSIIDDLLVDNGLTNYAVGPISTDLRNDSEDSVYRNNANGGRIDFWNAIVDLVDQPRLCNATKQTWLIKLTKYTEAKANENQTIAVSASVQSLIDIILTAPPAAWTSLFDWYYTTEAQPVIITQIGNTRVYAQTFILNAVSYK